MEADNMSIVEHDANHATLGAYISGFVLSIGCTLAAFGLVETHVRSHHATFGHPFLIGMTAALAIVQFFVQLYSFLHLGHGTKPRWKFLVFWWMICVVLILVLGSVWIMSNLNYRMTPRQMNQYMLRQDGGI